VNRALGLAAATGLLFVSLAPERTAEAFGGLQDLYMSPDMMMMGNAGVAVVEGHDSLFYNPAGLAGVQKTSFRAVSVDLQAPADILTTYKDLSTLSSISPATINSLMGKDIYGEATINSSYVMPNFGFAVIADGQLAVMPKNKALPQLTLGDQTTSGVQVSYGMTITDFSGVGKRKKKKKGSSKHELRVGMGAKYLFRRGGYQNLTLSQILNMGLDEYHQIVGNYGQGYGFDSGFQYLYHVNQRVTLAAGASYMQMGGIGFNATASTLEADLTGGVAAKYEFPGISATLAYDCKHINMAVDPRLRNHIGLQLGIPLFTVAAGISEGYPTYGISTDLWAARVTALTYTEELGTLQGQDSQRRYMLRVSVGLGI
jgi:hypothetical protein